MAVSANETTDFFLPEDRLYYATRAVILWLQGLFSTRPAGRLKWCASDSETELLIYSGNPTNVEESNKRPFIAVHRGVAQFLGTSLDTTLSRSFAGDEKKLTDTLGCSLTIQCCAREGVEAQETAYIIARMVQVFKSSIMKLNNTSTFIF